MNKKHKYTPLDALKEIENSLKNTDNLNLFNVCNLKVIRTALKDYEHLQETRYVIMGGRCSGKNHMADILLKLKALEIIKEKRVAINILYISSSAYVYNELYEVVIIPSGKTTKWEYKLQQAEYDLLKEVLLCD